MRCFQYIDNLIEGMVRILDNPNEIKEIQNAYEAYELMLRVEPSPVENLLQAHQLMVNGLVPGNGRFRSVHCRAYGKT